jgi:predicted nuclease of predicted toxin-antitoxin system
MSRLFIGVYLDEDVSVLIAQLLRFRQYEALTAQEAGNLQLTDAEQLAFAASRGLAVLTHNRDDYLKLAEEYRAGGKTHYGILIAIRRGEPAIVQRLLRILEMYTANELENQTIFV